MIDRLRKFSVAVWGVQLRDAQFWILRMLLTMVKRLVATWFLFFS